MSRTSFPDTFVDDFIQNQAMENPSHDSVVPGQGKRIRTLTAKGKEIYEDRKNDFVQKLLVASNDIESYINSFDTEEEFTEEKTLTLEKLYQTFLSLYDNFTLFLYKMNASDREKEIDNVKMSKAQVAKKVGKYLHLQKTHSSSSNASQINTKISSETNDDSPRLVTKPAHPKNTSQSVNNLKSNSEGSGGTMSSRRESLIMAKRAKAEAAKAKVKYAQQEAELMKQRADLDAKMKVLVQEKEAAAAEAELQVLESENLSVTSRRKSLDLPSQLDPMELTNQYVLHQANYINQYQHLDCEIDNKQKIGEETYDIIPTRTLNAEADTFVPHVYNEKTMPTNHHHQQLQDVRQNDTLTQVNKLFLKKDLMLTRLTVFNDQAEFYPSWKASFQNVMRELDVTLIEEIDLLVKWLGTESRRHALSIRASCINNPWKGRNRIWERLDERFGSPEKIEAALRSKITNFPKLTQKDTVRLYELADVLAEIEAVKDNTKYQCLLSYYDSSSGINPIVTKLPYGLQEKWVNRAAAYKLKHNVAFPPFHEFCDFVREISRVKNDPSFQYKSADYVPNRNQKTVKQSFVAVKKTGVDDKLLCPLHKTNHRLNDCRGFRTKSLDERKEILKEHKICFRCCATSAHKAKGCKENIRCECGSNRHPSALHPDVAVKTNKFPSTMPTHGGEPPKDKPTVSPKCTQICGHEKDYSGKSCAKLVLVNVYTTKEPTRQIKAYAILDDQSNRSLATTHLFEELRLDSEEIEYTITSCMGSIVSSGRRATNCVVQAIDGSVALDIPTIIECNKIPDNKSEIPTPEVAMCHPHLQEIANEIPPFDPNVKIMLLIGRDVPEAHHVLDQKLGPRLSPYGQKLNLGWVIIGEVCLGKKHRPDKVNVNKTHLLSGGRASIFKPCTNEMDIHENYTGLKTEEHTVFTRNKADDKPGLSIEDREFLEIMDNDFCKDPSGKWVAPLPFKRSRQKLPNNKSQAMKRASLLHKSLERNPTKKDHFLKFMDNLLANGHAELAPTLAKSKECWYLPIFGVYHPKKPDQIRAVFDSSAKYQGVSLNDVLLSGPDLTNSILGILLRFRKDQVAITADIQQMFYGFQVKEDHRDFLRFLWYRNNDPEEELTEYRMCVHVFGNSPSPAVATYGLRRAANLGSEEFGNDVRAFVGKDFYVDDGLTSLPTSSEVVDLMKRTQNALLKEGKLRLHKIVSNSIDVMKAFPSTDLANGIKDLNLNKEELPSHRTLGLSWDLKSDSFTFDVSSEEKPFTRRGVLSTINSLYDPLGIIAPVTVQGKLLLRELMADSGDWDDALPSDKQHVWNEWRNSLKMLEQLRISRSYTTGSLSQSSENELHVFSDASEKAIASVAYLISQSANGTYETSFVMGKAKVAPKTGHTIPRLELCAALLSVEMTEIITEQLGIAMGSVTFHTDSKVVLGYITNNTRRFYNYVANRVERIRKTTSPKQWRFVRTDLNPADCATRPFSTQKIFNSAWLAGPPVSTLEMENEGGDYSLVSPENDKEIRTESKVLKTDIGQRSLGTERFSRFSNWNRLVKAIARLKHIGKSFKLATKKCGGWHMGDNCLSAAEISDAEQLIVKITQQKSYAKEIASLLSNGAIPSDSPLKSLNPILDDLGLVRVGGRLNRSRLTTCEKNPIIIHGKEHIAKLLVMKVHEDVKHQGRLFTEGAIRSSGYWIIGAKRLVSTTIHKCIKCRKLRGVVECQKMADLPPDRLEPAPPFTYVGVDCFGPWPVTARRTRGGHAKSKRWAVIFTCLTTRGVHIEVIEEMSSSAFINALRRFTSIRGSVKEFRSDRGTNFVGAIKDLKIDAVNVEDRQVVDFLNQTGTTWIFNPPHSSHMGGVWERMIGITRRILDAMLLDHGSRDLTHDVLSTFMAEVCAVINSRPLVPVSTDPEHPEILTPSILLTQKWKTSSDVPDFESTQIDKRLMYRKQWMRVQILSDIFWKRWQKEYLQSLQHRRVWNRERPNLQEGDLVLLKEKDGRRYQWPVAVVDETLPSHDSLVRKAKVKIIKEGKTHFLIRPINEMILLMH